MEILKPIGNWCGHGIGFTLAFITVLAIGFVILSFLLIAFDSLRLFTIGGAAAMTILTVCYTVSEGVFSQQWVLILLFAALFSYSLYISHALDPMGFSAFGIIVEGLGVWIHGTIIICFICSVFLIPFIFIAGDTFSRDRP